MNSDLGRLYNDYMQEAVIGNPWEYSREERRQQVIALLEKGVLTQGIELSYAALLIEDGGGLDDKMRAYDLYMQAGQLGYAGSFQRAASEYDSWLLAQGKPQKFCTHWSWQKTADGSPIPKPIDDPDHVDERRAELGLPPMSVEAAELRKTSL